ncbi:Hsp90 binding co-chaperone Sba1 [Ophiocordyceps sinensis CO18]|uniref:Hsp90 binding co-chaperone Sba1 n=1 Tax=Ophiocordyceps sinensis (strain Co18 / CGMCC 3.14243) TaxID=911162 RepID=T4ZZR7_OPHSC|nr:Hsp90 binding co-chaperone Sba1 [Ophiocordyceps sinensis CO18]
MAASEASAAPPEVLWAQRSSVSDPSKNFIYLTLSVPDVSEKDTKLDLQPTSLSFTGTSTTLKRKFHVDLDFYAEIDPAESKINQTSKNIEIKLQKKELKEEYWPRLLKDSKKPHFLKTNFDKWADEDEQNEVPEDDFSQFGGAGGAMGGMPGMGGDDYGGIDFSKLAAGGMGGMGGMDDDELPALEDKAADQEENKA